MSVKNKKDEIINEIMNLRTMVGELLNKENEEYINEIQSQINKIHDKVFGV